MEHSPLCKLPAEIRNMIWELTLRKRYVEVDMCGRARSIGPHALALTATCRAIRAETIQLFYAINTIQIYRCPQLLHRALQEFSEKIGPSSYSAAACIILHTDVVIENNLDFYTRKMLLEDTIELRMYYGNREALMDLARAPGAPPLFIRIQQQGYVCQRPPHHRGFCQYKNRVRAIDISLRRLWTTCRKYHKGEWKECHVEDGNYIIEVFREAFPGCEDYFRGSK